MQGGAGPIQWVGPVRPAIHYSPAATWLNDPNGLIFHNSLWHLYYQTNPHGLTWGNMSWGHATSPDLAHWTEHETAISYDDAEAIFSGSMVCDQTDSAGFGAGALVAIYTSHRESPELGVRQAQSLAWSTDGGFTFHTFAGNPVLNRDSADFRDPKVFRLEGRWIMVAVEAVENVVLLYASDNLREWELLSEFRDPDAAAPTWECPDLFPLLDADGAPCWVLILSVNPEALTGGSGTRYYLGDFDGRTFTPSPDAGQRGWLDQGRDYYAAVSFSDSPHGRRVMIGWMNNWEYAHALPPQPWAMQMAWPRELGLASSGSGTAARGTRRLIQTPAPLPAGPECFSFEGSLAGVLAIPSAAASAPATIEVDLDRGHATTIEFTIGLTFVWEADTFTVRPRTGLSDNPVGFDRAVTTPLTGASHRFDVIVDHGSVEIFIDGGATVLTQLCPPALLATPWALRVSGDPAQVHIRARRLD
jgi:sucrose-6-phosphate hydrolase SacC (GH32 family)